MSTNEPTNADIMEKCSHHDEMIKEIRSDLYGNGRPGIKYEIVELKTMVRTSIRWTQSLVFAVGLPLLAFFGIKLLELLGMK